VGLYVCMYVRMFVCLYIWCLFAWNMHVCMFVCMHACMYECTHVCVYVCVYVCVCACACVCVCVYVCSLLARERTNRFAPNLDALSLRPGREHRSKLRKMSRVRVPVRALPVARNLSTIEEKHKPKLFVLKRRLQKQRHICPAFESWWRYWVRDNNNNNFLWYSTIRIERSGLW
jgi:hypothetical protein